MLAALRLTPSLSVEDWSKVSVLATTLFGIFLTILLPYAFKDCIEGVCLHTKADGKLFNIAHLRTKTKGTEKLIRELFFADDVVLTSPTEEGLQQLLSRPTHVFRELGLTISLRKTNIMAQGTDYLPNIAIGVGTTWKAWILSPILNLQFPTRSPLPQRLKQDRLGQVKRMH